MVTKKLSDGLSRYDAWKQDINHTIEDIQHWLEEKDLFSDDVWAIFARCLDKVESDRVTIAFVGEFSRGKTELINTLFFSDTGRRLLPSDAGRTTMCPTEITYDNDRDAAYIRLLPIETRLEDKSLTDYKHLPEAWTEIPLEVNNTSSLEQSFRELANVYHVLPDEAVKYGLYSEKLLNPDGHQPKYIDIPKWRHAIISYPHPLLKQGLNIIDTPGLNAIGSEPELTLNMLPSAQAAIFVLGADTGVSESDLAIWQNHLNGHIKSKRARLTVVLNKVDTMWDELRSEEEIAASIKSQILFTARTLGIPLKKIFPLSAQKSLIARIKKNDDLLSRSGITELEDHLNHEINQSKQDIIMQDIADEINQLLVNTRQTIHRRMQTAEDRLEEMANFHQQSDEAIQRLLEKTQHEQEKYRQNSNALKDYEKRMDLKTHELQEVLEKSTFAAVLDQTRAEIEKSWSQKGISKAVNDFITGFKNQLDIMEKLVEENRKIIREIYRQFEQQHGVGVIEPKAYSLDRHKDEYETLFSEAEAFAKGHRIALTGQSRIAKNFFSSIGDKGRLLLETIEADIHHWLNSSLQPLVFQVEDHRESLNRQVQDLKLATQSREKLDETLAAMASEIELHNQDIQQIEKFIKTVNQPTL